MKIRYDYEVYSDNAGWAHLFIRDYGDLQARNTTPILYYFFVEHGHEEAAAIIAEVMTTPNDICLDEWSLFGNCNDPQTALDEIKAFVAENNGGAWLMMEGNIYA